MGSTRRFGILIFCGVPAIVGGGIVYGVFQNYVSVGAFELLLMALALGLICR